MRLKNKETMLKRWKYNSPKFEFNNKTHSTWWGHVWFAYDLVSNMKPKCIVELGTHYGVSFLSICQAIKDGEVACELHAVDTWEGDSQARVGYEEKDVVYNGLKKEIDLNFGDLKINLHRKKFDEALLEFKDSSIDVLHIDGFHSYEAVKHDFESWLPKVKDGGVILFHDIHEYKEGFGVHILWKELKQKYNTIEFDHYHGLGVLFKNNNFDELLQYEDIWRNYYKILSEKNDANIKLENLNEINIKLKNLENIVCVLTEENNSIKSSKFWKLRGIYMRIKHWIIFIFFNPKKFVKRYLNF